MSRGAVWPAFPSSTVKLCPAGSAPDWRSPSETLPAAWGPGRGLPGEPAVPALPSLLTLLLMISHSSSENLLQCEHAKVETALLPQHCKQTWTNSQQTRLSVRATSVLRSHPSH